jgi:hypothetical protein
MTLEQVYFISQITAAAVLIASIIFLALQVRQNTKVIERSMMEDHRSAQDTVAQKVYEDREFAQFHMRSRDAYEELDELDRYRAEFLAIWRLRRILRVIQSRLDGLVSDVDWREIESGVRVGGKRTNNRVVWERMRNDYPRPVQDLYDEIANS